MRIVCKISKKSGKKYLVLVYNGVYVTLDRQVIEKVAMSVGFSNIELAKLDVDQYVDII